MRRQKIVVDTHYLIWDVQGHVRFTPEIEKLITSNADNIYISSISFWELGMLVAKKRVTVHPSIDVFFHDVIKYRNYKVLDLTPRMGDIISEYKNDINGDPADRVIAATTIAHNAMLVTADLNLRSLSFLRTYE